MSKEARFKETGTIDKLYLELSQFTKATSHKELYLQTCLRNTLHMCEPGTLHQLENIKAFLKTVCDDFDTPTEEIDK